MGVAVREDGGTVGVFSPKKVNIITFLCIVLLDIQWELMQKMKYSACRVLSKSL